MGEFFNNLLPHILEDGFIAVVTFLITFKQVKRGATLKNDSSEIGNVSKIIDEYQEYIESLKADRESALKERDEYKAQTQILWNEINELKRKLAIVEGQLSMAQVRLTGFDIDDEKFKETLTRIENEK